MRSAVFGAVIVASGVLLVGVSARADSKKYGELLKHLPDGANVIALVDVEGLINSPLGQREKWGEKIADRPNAVLGVSEAALRSVVAAQVDLQTFEERWKLSMVQLATATPKLAVLARREGGYIEDIEHQQVVWTPRNFYLIAFPEKIVGMVLPASRQLLAQWLRNSLGKPRAFPPGWADRALFRADRDSQVVIAVDLADAISPAHAEAWLRTLDSVTEGRHSPGLLAPQLASIKLAFLEVEVKSGITGTLHVEFDKPIDALKPVAKDVVLQALEACGVDIDDARRWDGEVKDRVIELSGPLDAGSLRRVLTLLSAPSLSTSLATGGGRGNPVKEEDEPAEATPTDVAKASQRYFRSVVDIVDSLKQQRNESYSRIRFWLDRGAKQIDELPLLDVDTDLLDWGGKVALTLREMSMSINYINKDKSYRLAGSAKGSYQGWYGGGTWTSMDSRSTNTQANAMINVDTTTRWSALQTAIGEMRKTMVQKYHVEF
jgi:hypothetical protein